MSSELSILAYQQGLDESLSGSSTFRGRRTMGAGLGRRGSMQVCLNVSDVIEFGAWEMFWDSVHFNSNKMISKDQ
jgi:hypothetical protein